MRFNAIETKETKVKLKDDKEKNYILLILYGIVSIVLFPNFS